MSAFAVFAPMLVLASIYGFFCLDDAYQHRRKDTKFLFILLVVFPIVLYGFYFIGLRPLDAGSDTWRYVITFDQLKDVSSARKVGSENYGNTELLWWPFQALFSGFIEAQTWLAVNFLFFVALMYQAYRVGAEGYRFSPLLFAYVFFTFLFVYSGNTVRQAAAIPLGLISVFYFGRGCYVRWVVFAFISMGMHWSAMVFFFAPLFRVRWGRDWIYLLIPCLAGLASVFLRDIVAVLVQAVQYEGFDRKYDIYFSTVRETHFGEVWQTFNFWLCIFLSFLFLGVVRTSAIGGRVIHGYTAFFLSLVLLGMNVADFSERYMPYLLAIFPIMLSFVLGEIRFLSREMKGVLYISFFSIMGFAVFMNKSAQITLGYGVM